MDSLDNTEWDVIIAGTGLPQSLLALALSRSDKKILHVDRNGFYGGDEAALSLSEAQDWAAKRAIDQHASVTVSTAADDASTPRLGSSRAYALALAPQLIYAQSSLLPVLVSSHTHSQLEFQAVGSWFTVRPPPDGSAASPPEITRVPSGREDIFQDSALDLRAKRSLMKFLRYVASYEEQDDWPQRKAQGFAHELTHAFALPPASHGPLLALALASDAARDTRMDVAVPRIARHVRSIGVFGPGFGAVLPKWGGLAEIAQVACRACAVGGGVYVLGQGIKAAEKASTDKLALELADGEKVMTRWLVGAADDVPSSVQPTQAGESITTTMTKSISIVSSSLSSLFPQTSEGGITPAGAVVLVETGGPPVRIVIHSSDAGECPSNQCVLYASTTVSHAFDVLEDAVQSLLRSVGEEPTPTVLWKMQYVHSVRTPLNADAPDSNEADESNVYLLPPLSPDVVLEDSVLESVKKAWLKITGGDEQAFMKFEAREGVGDDGDDETL